jgi:hypothetical protein
VKNMTIMVNSSYNGFRYEDVWLDKWRQGAHGALASLRGVRSTPKQSRSAHSCASEEGLLRSARNDKNKKAAAEVDPRRLWKSIIVMRGEAFCPWQAWQRPTLPSLET